MFRAVMIVLLFLAVIEVHGQISCGDQLQRCGQLAEAIEHEINAIRAIAFRSCFHQTSCTTDWHAFTECFDQSVHAIRSSSPTDQFASTARHFRSMIDRCFQPSHWLSLTNHADAPFSPFIDEVSIYQTVIYGNELIEQLWDLPSTSPIDANRHESCNFVETLVRSRPHRLFGSGGQPVDDPNFNNASSCLFADSELQCYSNLLDNDDRYQHLLTSRNQAIRSCIQSIRLQTQCRSSSNSDRLRSCLCNARDEFEQQLHIDIRDCVTRRQSSSIEMINRRRQLSDDTASSSASLSIVRGVVSNNGDCLCTCPSADVNDPKTQSLLRDQQQFSWLMNRRQSVADRITSGSHRFLPFDLIDSSDWSDADRIRILSAISEIMQKLRN